MIKSREVCSSSISNTELSQNINFYILLILLYIKRDNIYTYHRRLAGGTKYCTRTRVQYFICPRGRQPEEDIFSYSTEGPSGPSAIRFFRPRVEVMWIISTSVSFFLQILVFTLVSSRDPFLIQFHFYFQHVSNTIVPHSRRGMISCKSISGRLSRSFSLQQSQQINVQDFRKVTKKSCCFWFKM